MFRTCFSFGAAGLLVVSVPLLAAAGSADEPKTSAAAGPARSRTFQFTYAAKVTGLPPGKVARVWLPVPPSNEDQEVKILAKELPAEGHPGRDRQYGNRILYVEAKAGKDGTVPLSVTYQVTRREVKGDRLSPQTEPDLLARFLQPDAKVPVGGKPLELVKGKEVPSDQLAAARVLYDVVDDHMRYSKEGTGWGQGDAVWACDSKYGNCSDFHSLFISLARAYQMPAKFEIGFPLPEKRGSGDVAGYHCWAKFRPAGHGWIPVDISEANKNPKLRDYYFGNLTDDRVAFSEGRDITLAPKQDGPPLNFFIYPYVEVDGKPYAQDRVERKFSYQDVGGR